MFRIMAVASVLVVVLLVLSFQLRQSLSSPGEARSPLPDEASLVLARPASIQEQLAAKVPAQDPDDPATSAILEIRRRMGSVLDGTSLAGGDLSVDQAFVSELNRLAENEPVANELELPPPVLSQRSTEELAEDELQQTLAEAETRLRRSALKLRRAGNAESADQRLDWAGELAEILGELRR